MKTALTPMLIVLGWIGLFVAGQVEGQPPVLPIQAAQTGNVPVQNGSGQGNAPAASGVFTEGLSAPTEGGMLMDNGLWDGASAGPGCAMCGGGGSPPDWYTMQGVRVLSRSGPMGIPTSFRAPAQGYYSVAQITAGPPAQYQVTNLDIPTSTDISNGVIPVNNPYNVMGTNSFGLDVAAGYNMTIGHYFCRDRNNNDHFVEFSFWGLNSWSDSITTTGYLEPVYDQTPQASPTPIQTGFSGGSLRSPFLTPRELPGSTTKDLVLNEAFNHAIEHSIFYRSTMNNYELNGRFSPRGQPDRLVLHPDGKWRRECQPGTYMSYLYGLRLMQIDETFRFHSVGVDGTGAVNATGDYDIVTHNDLIGLQVGADMTFRKCRWNWGVEAKLGPYINFSDQVSTINASVIGVPAVDVRERLAASASRAALVGEVGFQATYKFRPNLVGRAAWDFMWVTGVALAPGQLDFSSTPTNQIATGGTVFTQGVSLGLEWLW